MKSPHYSLCEPFFPVAAVVAGDASVASRNERVASNPTAAPAARIPFQQLHALSLMLVMQPFQVGCSCPVFCPHSRESAGSQFDFLIRFRRTSGRCVGWLRPLSGAPFPLN